MRSQPKESEENMEYLSFNKAMRERFGCKVYKLSLDGGFTCPNRDGKVGYGGCIFCSERGSGDFAVSGEDLDRQIEEAKKWVAAKNPDGKYVAYFQNFTNTYAPLPYLKELFGKAIEHPEIVALDIATRPDCLEDEIVDYLAELNRIKPVMVELGLQTIHPDTADYIRRGYPLPVYDDAVRRLKAAGLEVITHMIIGLPGETKEDMVETAQYISDIGSDGIKLQLLHVLRGTDLAKDFEAGKFQVLEMDEYIDILIACLKVLRGGMVIHRLTGDGAKRDLIAPLWSADKKRVLNAIQKAVARA